MKIKTKFNVGNIVKCKVPNKCDVFKSKHCDGSSIIKKIEIWHNELLIYVLSMCSHTEESIELTKQKDNNNG